MSALKAETFEPVLLDAEPARTTEHGKRWINQRLTAIDKSWHAMQDVLKLREEELEDWAPIQRELTLSGVPTALTGQSQYYMAKQMDVSVGKTSFTLPAVIGVSLLTTAPTTISTGATVVSAGYTGYAILTPTTTTWTNAATAATPSVVTNAGALTWGACTAGTSTLLGVCVGDNATIASANLLWVMSVTSTVISTTQTPPTIASAAMSLSVNGS